MWMNTYTFFYEGYYIFTNWLLLAKNIPWKCLTRHGWIICPGCCLELRLEYVRFNIYRCKCLNKFSHCTITAQWHRKWYMQCEINNIIHSSLSCNFYLTSIDFHIRILVIHEYKQLFAISLHKIPNKTQMGMPLWYNLFSPSYLFLNDWSTQTRLTLNVVIIIIAQTFKCLWISYHPITLRQHW